MIPAPASERLKVSIIMPTYNRADYIAETIDSILAQTYTNWELLIMDDGSTDNTSELVSKIDDKRILYFTKAHTGITGILKNEAVRKASGQLLAFIDSDDLWAKEKLEKQVVTLAQNREARFVITNGYNFYDKGVAHEYFYSLRSGSVSGQMFLDYCQGKICAFTQALMVWKDCVDNAGLFNETQRFNDFSFLGNLAYHFEGILLYDPLIFRRLHASNTITTDFNNISRDFFETIENYKAKGMLDTTTTNKILHKAYLNIGSDHLTNKQKNMAISYFIKAWQSNPLSIIPLKKIAKALIS